MAFKRSLPTRTILWLPGASFTSFGSLLKSDLGNCLEILCETALKLLFDSAFTALMECHSNSNQSFSLSLFAFKKYLYTFRLFLVTFLQVDWVSSKQALFCVVFQSHISLIQVRSSSHSSSRFCRFQSWMKPTHCTFNFGWIYNSLFKSEKLLGYCHFLLGADQFLIWNQIMLSYPVVYRINPWTTRLDTMVSFKLFHNSSTFFWFLLVSIGHSWNKNREGHKVLLDVFVS